jgi:hypothetical protein
MEHTEGPISCATFVQIILFEQHLAVKLKPPPDSVISANLSSITEAESCTYSAHPLIASRCSSGDPRTGLLYPRITATAPSASMPDLRSRIPID